MKHFLRNVTVTLMLTQSVIWAQYEDSGHRGVYFPKKTYSGGEIPSFEKNKDRLPSPILEDNKEWVDLYWKAWELAFHHFKKPPEGSPFVSNYIDEAFSPSIFQWDTIFMIMFARYAHYIFPSIGSLDNFYCRQYENGYICREIQEADGQDFVFEGRDNTVNPPLFSWAEVENYKITGDKSRFRSVLPVLEKYAQWLEKYRKKEGTRHGLYWQTGLGSGMDNSPRNGSAWVDMSSQIAMLYSDMAKMCDELGETSKAETFRMNAKSIADKINSLMWNKEDGMYYDLDDNSNQIKVKTIASFWPLLAGIASDEQASRLYLNLRDPKLFWRTIPFASLSADHPDYKPDGQYWLGSVWAPTNVAVIQGLNKYGRIQGFDEFASLAAETYLEGLSRVYKKTGTLWENYSPDSYSRGIWSKPDFVGWTGCGPIELLIENVLGFNPDGANRRLTWTINRIDRHGIEGLRFGDITVTAISNKRTSVVSPLSLEIESDRPFELTVVYGFQKSKTFNLEKGKHQLSINN